MGLVYAPRAGLSASHHYYNNIFLNLFSSMHTELEGKVRNTTYDVKHGT